MGVNPSAFASIELRARAAALVLIGCVLALTDAITFGARTLAFTAAGAVLFGGWMYWRSRGRVGGLLAGAGAVPAAAPEPGVDTLWRAAQQMAPALVVLLMLDFVFDGVASVAGIPLGAGVALALVATRLIGWESENSLRLLHELRPGFGVWRSWLGVVDPTEYTLCADAGITPAVPGASARGV